MPVTIYRSHTKYLTQQNRICESVVPWLGTWVITLYQQSRYPQAYIEPRCSTFVNYNIIITFRSTLSTQQPQKNPTIWTLSAACYQTSNRIQTDTASVQRRRTLTNYKTTEFQLTRLKYEFAKQLNKITECVSKKACQLYHNKELNICYNSVFKMCNIIHIKPLYTILQIQQLYRFVAVHN